MQSSTISIPAVRSDVGSYLTGGQGYFNWLGHLLQLLPEKVAALLTRGDDCLPEDIQNVILHTPLTSYIDAYCQYVWEFCPDGTNRVHRIFSTIVSVLNNARETISLCKLFGESLCLGRARKLSDFWDSIFYYDTVHHRVGMTDAKGDVQYVYSKNVIVDTQRGGFIDHWYDKTLTLFFAHASNHAGEKWMPGFIKFDNHLKPIFIPVYNRDSWCTYGWTQWSRYVYKRDGGLLKRDVKRFIYGDELEPEMTYLVFEGGARDHQYFSSTNITLEKWTDTQEWDMLFTTTKNDNIYLGEEETTIRGVDTSWFLELIYDSKKCNTRFPYDDRGRVSLEDVSALYWLHRLEDVATALDFDGWFPRFSRMDKYSLDLEKLAKLWRERKKRKENA